MRPDSETERTPDKRGTPYDKLMMRGASDVDIIELVPTSGTSTPLPKRRMMRMPRGDVE